MILAQRPAWIAASSMADRPLPVGLVPIVCVLLRETMQNEKSVPRAVS